MSGEGFAVAGRRPRTCGVAARTGLGVSLVRGFDESDGARSTGRATHTARAGSSRGMRLIGWVGEATRWYAIGRARLGSLCRARACLCLLGSARSRAIILTLAAGPACRGRREKRRTAKSGAPRRQHEQGSDASSSIYRSFFWAPAYTHGTHVSTPLVLSLFLEGK